MYPFSIAARGVRRKSWTGLCRKSEALSIFDRTERAKRHLDALFVIPANVGVYYFNELFDGRAVPLSRVEQLRFQSPEEPLTGRIVGRASFT